MAEKRDYYEVLGIDRNASASEKKPTENSPRNIIQIRILEIKRQKPNLKK